MMWVELQGLKEGLARPRCVVEQQEMVSEISVNGCGRSQAQRGHKIFPAGLKIPFGIVYEPFEIPRRGAPWIPCQVGPG